MPRIFVRPALDKSAETVPGQPPARLKVRKPVGGRLAEAGEWQNLDDYWQRRINDADVDVDQAAIEPLDPTTPGADSAAVKAAAKTAVKTN